MNKTSLLIVWNVLLSAVLGYALLRKSPAAAQAGEVTGAAPSNDTAAVAPVTMTTDTATLKNAHIAFFFMDSIQSRYALVKESADRVRSEGHRLEDNLAREMQKAQARAQELMGKDHTYSTQAEMEADQKELDGLQQKIAEMRSNSQDRIDEMQARALQEITMEIQKFLEEYNRTAGFDYIFSIQDGGQIWVGNKGLDITADVLNGLNTRHAAKRAGK